jgi:hypothetical protein
MVGLACHSVRIFFKIARPALIPKRFFRNDIWVFVNIKKIFIVDAKSWRAVEIFHNANEPQPNRFKKQLPQRIRLLQLGSSIRWRWKFEAFENVTKTL